MTPVRLDPRAAVPRAVRAAVLTAPTVGAAVLVHSLADGCGSLVGIALALGVCWPAAVALLGRRRSTVAVAGFVVLAQVATHVLLERLCPDVVSGQSTLLQHLAHGTTTSMVLAHAGAAAATALVLTRADARLWSTSALLRALRRLRRPVLAPLVVPVPLRARVVDTTDVPRLPVLERVPALRRGPPARSAA